MASKKKEQRAPILIKKAQKDLYKRDGSNAQKADQVYEQLADDYHPNLISWVRSSHWDGPMLVPHNQIDYSHQAEWSANDEPTHVEHFVKEIEDKGFSKPIVLVNTNDNKKLFVSDGRHRLLAYKKLGMPALAWVGTVGGTTGEFHDMHEMNDDGDKDFSNQSKSYSDQKSRSNQKTKSNQK